MKAPTHFLTLPPEIILACLAHLPLVDLASCVKVGNRLLRNIILTSVLIQYRTELQRDGVEENAALMSQLVISDRLKELRTREGNWLDFAPRSRQTIDVNFQPGSIYELGADVYFVGDKADPATSLCTALNYVYTSPGTEAPVWHRIEVGAPIIDFGIAIEEHDLVAVVTYTQIEDNTQMASIDIRLLSFSTGSTHRVATSATLHLDDFNIFVGRPSVSIDIVGPTLAISLVFWNDIAGANNKFYVFDWQRGLTRTTLQATTTGGVFLTPDILLIPDTAEGTLDVLHISDSNSDQPMRFICSFNLPALPPENAIFFFQCYAAPNPRNTLRHDGRAHFRPRPTSSLILFSFSTLAGNDYFFVLDRALFSRAVQIMMEDSETDGPGARLAWEAWGPRCTRWLDPSMRASRYITVACGQRLVSIARDAAERPSPIRILDFNTMHVHAQRAAAPRDGVRVVEADDPESPPEHGFLAAFSEPVVSLLEYVEITSKENFDYHAAIINDENVIGVKFGEGRVQSLEVLHFG